MSLGKEILNVEKLLVRKTLQRVWLKIFSLPKTTFLGPKRVKIVVFGPPQEFSQIGQKMAEIWPKDFSRPKEGQKCSFWPRKNFQPNWSKNGQKTLSRPKKGQKCGF